MIIVTEEYSNGVKYKVTRTDLKDKMLHRIGTGFFYDEAWDVLGAEYEYEEVDDPFKPDDEENGGGVELFNVDYIDAANKVLGFAY